MLDNPTLLEMMREHGVLGAMLMVLLLMFGGPILGFVLWAGREAVLGLKHGGGELKDAVKDTLETIKETQLAQTAASAVHAEANRQHAEANRQHAENTAVMLRQLGRRRKPTRGPSDAETR